MRSMYEKPILDGHDVLYKGKRYWVFKIDKNHPFQNYENDCSILIFDKYCGAVAAWCNLDENGIFRGYIEYGQGSIDIQGETPKTLVQCLIKNSNFLEKIK